MEYFCDNQVRYLTCLPYSIENLHEMAKDLGIKRCRFHKTNYPHYDIPKTRTQEISEKCTEVSTRELLNMIKDNIVR